LSKSARSYSRQAKLRRTPWRRRFRIGRSKAGLGLFALKPIKPGDFIAYYTGRLITNAAADKLWTKYMFEINNRWTLDGSSRRNIARYINHSCKPNAESDVKGHKVVITAIRTIRPGDEIAYNYGRDYFDTFIKPHGCRCVACRQRPVRKRSSAKRSRSSKRKNKGGR
jgi:SET domain-containing protein